MSSERFVAIATLASINQISKKWIMQLTDCDEDTIRYTAKLWQFMSTIFLVMG